MQSKCRLLLFISSIHPMEIVKKKSRSAKRLSYECAGQITIGNEMDEARLTNISASGIQFETPNRIVLNTKVQLLWTDPTLGILNPHLFVVRELHKPERERFKYIYGAQYHNLPSELKTNLIKLLRRLRDNEQRETLEKIQDASPKYLLEVVGEGLSFVTKFLNESAALLPILAKAFESMAEYERNAFELDNDIAKLIQKISAQTFQCKVLTSMVPIIYNYQDFKANYFMTVTAILQKIRETENARVLGVFQNFPGSDQQRKALLRRVEESKNRLFYAKQDLLQAVLETFESIDGKNPDHKVTLKVITSELEETLEVTNSSGFNFFLWKTVKGGGGSKERTDVIIDNRPPPGSLMSNPVLVLVFLILTFIFALILF